MPRSAKVRARTDATIVGYTAQAFRERLGVAGIGALIGQREPAASNLQ
jgi:putative ABC transport system ATP-binding protein